MKRQKKPAWMLMTEKAEKGASKRSGAGAGAGEGAGSDSDSDSDSDGGERAVNSNDSTVNMSSHVSVKADGAAGAAGAR